MSKRAGGPPSCPADSANALHGRALVRDVGVYLFDEPLAKAADGRRYIDLMLEEAPDLLWEADLAWIVRGGADPVAALKRYAGRIEAVHLKDIAIAGQCLDEDGWADPGHGVLDWSVLVPVLEEIGVTLFVAEHDKPNDVARFAQRAFDGGMIRLNSGIERPAPLSDKEAAYYWRGLAA